MSRRQRAVGKIVMCDTDEPIAAEEAQMQERIRDRAFQISLDRNHAGREIDDWLTAEAELMVSAPLEISAKDGVIVVRMHAAGVDPKDLTILASSDQALIKADFRHDHEPDAEIHVCDFRASMLFRSVHFPAPVDLSTLSTTLDEGILRITARRVSAATPAPAAAKPAVKKKAAAKKTKK